MTVSNYESYGVTAEGSYYARNGRWLAPLLAGLILAAASLLLPQFGGGALPGWAYSAGGVLCALAVGIGARTTDTLSAEIVSWVGFIVAVGVIVLQFLSSYLR